MTVQGSELKNYTVGLLAAGVEAVGGGGGVAGGAFLWQPAAATSSSAELSIRRNVGLFIFFEHSPKMYVLLIARRLPTPAFRCFLI